MAQSLLGAEEPEEERFRAVVDLDVFFKDMYTYHYHHGLPAIILTQFCAVCSLGFTVAFSVFILAFIDWDGLMQCHDEGSCYDLEKYIVMTHFGFSSFFGFIVMGYSVLFTCYWLFRCASAIQAVMHAAEMDKFYKEKLGITLQTLQTLSWNDVVQRLIRLHEHKIHRVAIKDRLTEHDVVSRILRKENYMVALINKGVLDLRLPWWATPFLGSDRLFLTKSLEWSLYFCILQHMFNDQFNVSSVFLRDIKGLKSRFLAVGVVHFLLLPFMLVFMTVHFFLQNAQQFHASKAYLGPRQWSPLALWTFREFNELLHVFEARINKSYAPANEYVQSFSNAYLSILARCVAYISGSFVAVLLLASVIDEAILLYVHTGDHNLLWYLGICSAAYAASRSLVPDETKTVNSATREELMDRITACTHYRPKDWIDRAHTTEVRDEMLELFPFKVRLFFMEVMSVIFTPVVLCFSLPQCSPSILEFIREHTSYVDGVGAVCDYSTFDLDRYGDEDYATAPEGGVVEVNRRPAHGKMEQSYLSFQHTHPDWQGHSTGRNMMHRLRAFSTQKQSDREYALSSALQSSLSMHMPTGTRREGDSLIMHRDERGNGVPGEESCNRENHTDASGQMRMQHSFLAPGTEYDFRSGASMSGPFVPGRASAVGMSGVPSVLRSVLKQENIDFENDFYWLSKFQQERRHNPEEMEQSLQRSMSTLMMTGVMNRSDLGSTVQGSGGYVYGRGTERNPSNSQQDNEVESRYPIYNDVEHV